MTLRRSIRLPTHILSSHPIRNNHPARRNQPICNRRPPILHPPTIRTDLRTH